MTTNTKQSMRGTRNRRINLESHRKIGEQIKNPNISEKSTHLTKHRKNMGFQSKSKRGNHKETTNNDEPNQPKMTSQLPQTRQHILNPSNET